MDSDNRVRILEVIASKTPEFNRDINQHIISCKIALDVIYEQHNDMTDLRDEINSLEKKVKNLEGKFIVKQEEKRQDELKIKRLEKHNKEQEALIKELYKWIH